MNHFTKLKSRESFSLRWLLLSLLLLVNVGVWATSYKKITSAADLEVGKNYLIVYENGTTGYVMGAVSTKNFMESVQATISDGVLTLPDNANVFELGGNDKGYTLKASLNNQYLNCPSNSTNLGTNGTVSNKTKWTIEFVNGFAHIANVNLTTRYVKIYTSNYTFRAYTATNGAWVSLYKEDAGDTPSISATDVTYEADATKGEIPYTINNGDGSTLSASSETAWISNVTVDAEKVTFDMAENTEAAPREGVVTLTYGSVTKNVTVTQKAPVIKYNITWSVNGVTTTEQVEQGQPITFDNAPEGIPSDYVFTGWYGDEYFNATDAPAYVSSATATADVTYYAVFAKKSEGGEEPSLVKMTMSDNFKDGDKVVIVANVDATTVYGIYQETYNSSYVGKFEFENDVESISKDDKCWLTVSGTDGKWVFGDDTYGYLYSSGSNNLSVDTSNKTEFTLETDEANGKFKIKATESKRYLSYRSDIITKYFRLAGTSPTGTFRFDIYKYVCGSVSYSDFRTSLADVPATATITLSEKCTDGEMYYGTYSSTKPFVVSDDIIVSEISVIDNQLYVEEYASGAVVPANIGVMVSSMTYGNHEVALSEENGQSVLGEDNMLRPTGDAGITAAEMAAKDAACKYYRLTMHKGETLGYFYGAAEGAAFNIAAGKAYLAVPEALASKVLGFAIGGGVTGIGAVADNGNAAGQRTVYNLHGQRVNGKLAKGVYIVNGKKVIIK